MKSIYFILFCGFSCVCLAQYNRVIDPSSVSKVTISVPDVRCINCKKNITNFLLRTEGIVSTNLDLINKMVSVSYVNSIIDIDEIRVAIANTGYDADTVKANESIKRLLPICCLENFDSKSVEKYIQIKKLSSKKVKRQRKNNIKHLCCFDCDIVSEFRNLKK